MRHLDNTFGHDGLTRFVSWWAAAVFRAPRRVLFVVGLLMMGSIALATGLKIDTDSSRMLSEDLDFQAQTRAIAEAFPATKRTILVLVRSRHRDAADAAVAQLTARLTGHDGDIARVFAPSEDAFLVSHGLLYDDLDTLDRRLFRLSQASNVLAELRVDQSLDGFLTALDGAVDLAAGADIDPKALAPFLAEAAAVFAAERQGSPRPFDWQAAFSDGDTGAFILRTIGVEPVLDFTRLSPAKPAISLVRDAVAALDPELAGLVEVGITGDPVLRAEELESVTAQLGLSLLLSVGLVTLVLFAALRRPGRVAVALATLLVTLVLTVGFTAAAVGALNLISIAFVVLMVGLGIDFAIHFLSHLEEEAQKGTFAAEAVVVSGNEIGAALFLSAITTSIAFLAFTATDFVGMAQLGLIGGVGVLIAFLASITVIPALVALRPGILGGRSVPALPSLPRPVARGLILVAILVGAASLFQAPQARFDADPMKLRNPDAASVQAYDWLLQDPDRAPQRMGVIAESREEAVAMAARLDAVPEVENALWLGDLVPKDQDEKLMLIDLAWPSLEFIVVGTPVALASEPETEALLDRLPDRLRALGLAEADVLAREIDGWRESTDPVTDRALAAGIFRFFPQLIGRIEAQLDVDYATVDSLPDALVDRYRSADGRYLVDIVPKGDVSAAASRAAFVEAVNAEIPAAAGPPAQIHGAVGSVSQAMLTAAGLALVGTILLALLVLRRVALVAAIVIPLCLAGTITLAVSSLIGIPFNFANIIVLPLMIGVGVDSGIHLALRTARSDGTVFGTSTPRAVLASALTTIAAFGTLSLSDHAGTASMGVMLAISMLASVVMIFAITPVLVRGFTGR
ncbi:MAG: MMPL family transporter [Alphaproteobacteria bacterium]|nr:MMPL family transporter [Alphaproteobacteria bacterium]